MKEILLLPKQEARLTGGARIGYARRRLMEDRGELNPQSGAQATAVLEPQAKPARSRAEEVRAAEQLLAESQRNPELRNDIVNFLAEAIRRQNLREQHQVANNQPQEEGARRAMQDAMAVGAQDALSEEEEQGNGKDIPLTGAFDIHRYDGTLFESALRDLKKAQELDDMNTSHLDEARKRVFAVDANTPEEKRLQKELLIKIRDLEAILGVKEQSKKVRGIDPEMLSSMQRLYREQFEGEERAAAGLGSDEATPPEIQERVNRRVQEVMKPQIEKLSRDQERDPYGMPKSTQEVVAFIVENEGEDLWGPQGEFPLLYTAEDEKKGKGKEGELNQGNFLRWVRQRMMRYIDINPDNPIDLFQSVGIERGIRQYNIMQMILNPRAFFYDEKKGEILRDLAEHILTEIWLRTTSHKNDTTYRSVAGQEGELFKILGQIYNTNDFTKRGSLNLVLELASADKLVEIGNDRIMEKNQGVGTAIRAALLSYYYISDREMLEKIYEKKGDAALFSNMHFKDVYKKEKRKEKIDKKKAELKSIKKHLTPEDERKIEGDVDEAIKKDLEKFSKLSDTFFDEKSGQLKPGSENSYMDYLNIFNNPDKDTQAILEVRERIRVSLMEQFGLAYDEAQYAEWWAHSMASWMGAAARNDVDAIGHDSWSKILNFRDYRFRQASGQRAAVFGNKYNILNFKRLGLDFLAGTKDQNQRTILEAIQGGQAGEIHLVTPELVKRAEDENLPEEERRKAQEELKRSQLGELRFGVNTQRQFFANHIAHTTNLYKYLGEGNTMDFDQFVQIDPFGRVVFDHKKANEVLDGVFKSFRYAYATWPLIDYSKKVRYWELQRDKSGNPAGRVQKERSIAEELFGREILSKEQYYKMYDRRFHEFVGKDWTEELENQIQAKFNAYKIDKKDGDVERDYTIAVEKDEKGKIKGVILRMDNISTKMNRNYRKKYGDVVHDADGRTEIDGGQIQLSRNRAHFWKESVKEELAAQMLAHRDPEGHGRRYTMEEIERIYSFLANLPGNIGGGEEDMRSIHSLGYALTPEDIKWIRKKSKTETWRMFRDEAALAIGVGGFGAIWNILKLLTKETTGGK